MELTIITINYNNLEGLKRTFNSVIAQKFCDYEWIIIDGGSTDGSKSFIEENKEYFSFWCSEKDNGIYNAMNKGIKYAQGEYIHFLNSGDILFDDQVYNTIFSQKTDADILYGNVMINKNGKSFLSKGFHSNYLSLYDFTTRTICHQAAFHKRDLYHKYGNYDETLRIVADWKFFIKTLIINKCSIKYYNETIIVYGEDGISSIQTELRNQERMEYLKEILPEFAIEDYIFHIKENEIRKYKISRLLYSVLYRVVMAYEKYFQK